MKREIVFATNNKNKLKEVRRSFEQYNIKVLSLNDVGIYGVDPEETGTTFEENARIKSTAFSNLAPDRIIVADDSGMCVDALNGEPGVYSHRYTIGEPQDLNNMMKVLDKLKKHRTAKERKAIYVCYLHTIMPGGHEVLMKEDLPGVITLDLHSVGGFGYDPIFVPTLGMSDDEITDDVLDNKPYSEYDPEERFTHSQRSRCALKVARYLDQYFNEIEGEQYQEVEEDEEDLSSTEDIENMEDKDNIGSANWFK